MYFLRTVKSLICTPSTRIIVILSFIYFFCYSGFTLGHLWTLSLEQSIWGLCLPSEISIMIIGLMFVDMCHWNRIFLGSFNKTWPSCHVPYLHNYFSHEPFESDSSVVIIKTFHAPLLSTYILIFILCSL